MKLPSSPRKGARIAVSPCKGITWHLVYDGRGRYPYRKEASR